MNPGFDTKQLSPEEVIEIYTEEIERQPDRPFSVYRDLGNAYVQTQQFERAVEAFQKSIQLQPQRSLLHSLLAQTEYERGNHPEAIESYMQAIQLVPNQPYQLYDRLNKLFSKTQHVDRGISFYKRLISQNSSSSKLYYGLGALQLKA